MNQIDKMFKHKLEHYHVEIPDGAWENIASRLPEPKRKYRPWWALASVLTVVLIAGGTSLFMSDSSKSTLSSSNDCKIHSSSIANNQFAEVLTINHENKNDLTLLGISGGKNETSTSHLQNATDKHKSLNIDNKYIKVSKDVTVQNIIDIPENDIVSYESRNFVQIPYLATNTINHDLVPNRKLLAKGIFIKEKEAKACPFVIDTQDKSVDLYFSHDFVTKSLSGSAELADYKNMRLATEQPMYSYSAGARFGYNLSYRWNIHTGFNYSQINEKFEYVDPESKQTVITKKINYVYDNGRIIDSVVTEETVILPGTTKLSVYNKYRTFDIPLLGRYTIFANKYLSLSGVAGIFFNISMHEKGMILDANNNKPISFYSKDDEGLTMFKTQLGLSGYGSLSLAYHISDRLDFLLEPNIRLHTEPMTNEQYPLAQKFSTFGISTGLRYKF